MQSILYYIQHPRKFALAVLANTANLFPEKFYLKLRYWLEIGKWLDFDNLVTFNEKIQWLKLYNRKPEYTTMVDKYAVKKYVADKIGEEYVIPTIGVWDSVDKIDFDKLPNQFVLKTTHGGGGSGVIICKDKSKLDLEQVRASLRKALKLDIYKTNREWPYKNVPRRILAEQYMEDESGFELKDYKLFCFNGQVKFCKVDFDRFVEHHANYYTPDWTLLPFGEADLPPNPDKIIPKPEGFENMVRLANILAKDIPFARIDFYSIKERTYFGEITFYPAGGMGIWVPVKADETIGKMLKLPNTI